MSDRGVAAYAVLREVRPLSQASARAVADVLRGTGWGVATRAVLEHLLRTGPSTVPAVAREFGVSRQSIQVLVDAAVADGLLELTDNPQHRRSRLVDATDGARRTFEHLHRQELANLARVTADLDPGDLARCAATLAALTERVKRLQTPDHTTEEP